ncbi:hypothetical protein Hypma_003767 [Hypsizygus marmoreus]|uniref:Uncharacterized protein n=2 Tax=Hypsizygus marmoreus TaxID=39966 RepID=A0A369K9C6_HYPMA|nr:hypothetical protein Hypma_003767 [Hypsizygus marmoreus]
MSAAPGVIDANGFAICPDCDTNVNCGKVGISNLEKRHRGKKVCLDQIARRDKSARTKKNTSILSFLQPKPARVPSTVTAPSLIGGSGSSSTWAPLIRSAETLPDRPRRATSERAPVIQKLRNLVLRLPTSVLVAVSDDALAIFSGNPEQTVDPQMDGDEIWEGMMNSTLKRALGWGRELDLTGVVRRGALGMDGFVKFLDYFMTERGVSAERVEGKLEYLFETLAKMTAEVTLPLITPVGVDNEMDPASVRAVASSQADEQPHIEVTETINIPTTIDVDALPDDVVVSSRQRSTCTGYHLPIPDGQSPHSTYPFALHDSVNPPWDYSVVNGVMSLVARGCDGTPMKGREICRKCENLENNMTLTGILSRMKDGVHENAPFAYHPFSGMVEVLHRKSAQIKHLRLRGLNQARKLLVQATALSDHKRFALAIASGAFERVGRLVSIALKQRRGIRGILTLYDAAAKGIYKPKSYTEEDDMRGLLLWRLGGNRIAHIAHRALGLPGLTTLRNRSIMPPLITSPSMPTTSWQLHI